MAQWQRIVFYCFIVVTVSQGYASPVSEKSNPDFWYWCTMMSSTFTPEQFDLCLEQPDVIIALTKGGGKGLWECERVFFYEIWNCTQGVVIESNTNYAIGDGSREDGYLQSIRSASMVMEVAEECADGKLKDCSCAQREQDKGNQTWKWSGCEQKMDVAERIVYDFLSSERFENASEDLNQMKEHNARVGIEAVKQSQRTECHCQGALGSCAYRTCFKHLPKSLEAVANELKSRYERAQKVILQENELVTVEGKTGADINEMVYVRDSPDHCDSWPGPSGRECVIDTNQMHASCPKTCCQRGWVTTESVRERPCNCSMAHDVAVDCKICHTLETVRYCK